MEPAVARHRTAMQRRGLSRPVRSALDVGLITADTDVFDYGCGRGDDIRLLRSRGIRCAGWDPIYRPRGPRGAADVVNLGYVINVIEDPEERAAVLREGWTLARKLLIVSARLTLEAKEERQRPYRDGYMTRLGTFQKYYQQHELRDWINQTLGVSCMPAAPGVFYVFRDADLQQSFVASRYRRRGAAPGLKRQDHLFDIHKPLFEALMAFVLERGRLPDASELREASQLCEVAGSLQRAFAIIRRMTGVEQWDRIREERSQDLLIYLGLARFDGRPRYADLALGLQRDVRAFFSTYRKACQLADELLFSAGDVQTVDAACRASQVGKLTPNALYVHDSALPHLPPALRVYEGCARHYIGAVEGANIIKLHRKKPQVSYLSYPSFEQDPHPPLAASLIVPLQSFQVQYRDYMASKNHPILHRKEAFLMPDHPLYGKFARLTRQEEKCGLYENPQAIGTKEGWLKALAERKVRLAGHRVLAKLSKF